MDQDATWYGARLRPRQHCVRRGPSSPKKGHSPHFSAHVYFGQTAGLIKTPLGTEVDLAPGDIVLNGDPGPLKRGTAPTFRPMSIVAILSAMLLFSYEALTPRSSMHWLLLDKVVRGWE